MTVVAGNGAVTPSLVNIASSAERLSKLTASGDCTIPVSSDFPLAGSFTIAIATATAKATHDYSVKRAYLRHPNNDLLCMFFLPFPASLNNSDVAQHLTRSVRSAMSYILVRCDDRCTEGVRSNTWVPGWDHPLHMAFKRAGTPDNPTTARLATSTDFFRTGVMGHGRRSIWA